MSSIGHRVRLPGEAEEEVATQTNQKRRVDKTNDRTYNIIMNDQPKHRFHLRYVVYSAGVLLGFSLLYKYNTRFRLSCQRLYVSYQCGRLYNDFKNWIVGSWFTEEAAIKKGWKSVTDKYQDTKTKLSLK